MDRELDPVDRHQHDLRAAVRRPGAVPHGGVVCRVVDPRDRRIRAMAPRPLRICLIGPECTGKSTLAARAERELGATWVREYAREYAECRAGFSPPLSAADVEPI